MLTQGNHKEPGLEELLRKDYKYLYCVHRLDKPVSGLVVFAKSSKALSRLNASQREGKWTKKYLARVEGNLTGSGTLKHYLIHGDHKAEIDPSGKLCILDYVVKDGSLTLRTEVGSDALAKVPGYKNDDEANSKEFGEEEDAVDWCLQQADEFRYVRNVSVLVEITLHTGRYHQIRAQFGVIGHPILGDQKYGSKTLSGAIALHHSYLSFPHPVKDEQVEVICPTDRF